MFGTTVIIMTKQQLLNSYYPSAVAATAGSGIFPQTLISQLILESGYNLSQLAIQYNNFFGIKATPNWNGAVVSKTTTEQSASGNTYTYYGSGMTYNSYADAVYNGEDKQTLFRVYNSVVDGFKGYVSFLENNDIYANAGVFDAATPQEQFKALQAAGYATEHNYASQLTDVYNSIKDYLPTVALATGGGLVLVLIGWGVYKLLYKN
jgi:flagellum-specific peptidoglycan hydrolase FlgJ